MWHTVCRWQTCDFIDRQCFCHWKRIWDNFNSLKSSETSSEVNSTGISADEVDIEDEPVGDDNDDASSGMENVYGEAAPTYEEALEMETITWNDI